MNSRCDRQDLEEIAADLTERSINANYVEAWDPGYRFRNEYLLNGASGFTHPMMFVLLPAGTSKAMNQYGEHRNKEKRVRDISKCYFKGRMDVHIDPLERSSFPSESTGEPIPDKTHQANRTSLRFLHSFDDLRDMQPDRRPMIAGEQ